MKGATSSFGCEVMGANRTRDYHTGSAKPKSNPNLAMRFRMACQTCGNLLCMATQADHELCSRCGHERDSHLPDCRAEISDRKYMYLCPCIAFVPPREPNTQKKSPSKQ